MADFSAFKQRQMASPKEEVTCGLCRKKGSVEDSYTTCLGWLICGKCERGFQRNKTYVKPRKSSVERAHDRLYAAYLRGKACPEIMAQFSFPSGKKGEDPCLVRGAISEKTAKALCQG